MAEERQDLDVDSWDDFQGVYMKADDVKEWPLKVVPKQVEAYIYDKKAKLDYVVEFNGKDRKIGINVTNRNVIKKHNLTPKQALGKVFVFGKCRVKNPSSNEMVDSFDLVEIKDTP